MNLCPHLIGERTRCAQKTPQAIVQVRTASEMYSVLCLFALLSLAYSFPTGFDFTCMEMNNPSAAAAVGYKSAANTMWHVFAEEFMPVHDRGEDTMCSEDSTGYVLTCKIAWTMANTTSTQFTFTFDPAKLTAMASLVTPDGKTHALSTCRYGGTK